VRGAPASGPHPDGEAPSKGPGAEGQTSASERASASGLLLAIETSGTLGSVALARDGALVAARTLEARSRHAAHLPGALDAVLDEAGEVRGALDGIVVGAGPGSFTGVRIAAATAKALRHALGLPLWAPSSLVGAALDDRIALPSSEDVPRYVLFDARAERVYAACVRLSVQRGGKADVVQLLRGPRATKIGAIVRDGVPSDAVFLGDGARRHRERLESTGAPVLEGPAGEPSARGLLRAVALGHPAGPVDRPARWEPDYLRDPGAARARRSAGAGAGGGRG